MVEWNQLMNQMYELVEVAMGIGLAKEHVSEVINSFSSQNRYIFI